MPAQTLPGTFYCPLDDIGLLGFEGLDARAFLQAQLSNDVDTLSPGRGQWTSYNSPKGRVLANPWLWQAPGGTATERYDALVAADLAAATQKRLAMFVLRAKLRVSDRTAAHRFFGIGGAGAATALATAFGCAPGPGETVDAARASAQVVALPDGRFVAVVPSDAAGATTDALARQAALADANAWRTLGVAAGVAWITAATSDRFVAQMINWDALSGVSFRKGCYPGQEVVARMRYLGRLKERLFLLRAEVPPPDPATRLFSPVFGEQPCGTVVNAVPANGGTDFLAVVQLSAADAPGLALGAPGGAPVDRRPLPYALPEVTEPRGRIA